METIYEHGVTEQELTALFGPEEERETREEYLEFLNRRRFTQQPE